VGVENHFRPNMEDKLKEEYDKLVIKQAQSKAKLLSYLYEYLDISRQKSDKEVEYKVRLKLKEYNK